MVINGLLYCISVGWFMIGKPQKQEAEAGNLRKIKSNIEMLKKNNYLNLSNFYEVAFNFSTIGFVGTGHHGNI